MTSGYESFDRPRLLMAGAHLLRAGAGATHDRELARIGATTGSAARYVRSGEFGLCQATGELNDWIAEAGEQGLGIPVTVHAGIHKELPKTGMGYYFRPHKTIPALRRAVLEAA
jgi:hypothetical protein